MRDEKFKRMIANIKFCLRVALLSLLSFSCFSHPLLINETLCVPDSPPYSGKNLKSNGPLAELIVNSLKMSNIELKLISPPWARIMHQAQDAKCMIAGLWPSPQRRKIFYFSTKPVIKQTLGLYIKRNRKLEEIHNGTIAIQRSTYLSKNISQKHWKFYDVRSIKQGAQMLALSRVDALYAEVGRMNYLLTKNKDLANEIKLTKPIIENVYGYLAVSKKHENAENIIAALDKNIERALSEIKNPEIEYLNLANEFTATDNTK